MNKQIAATSLYLILLATLLTGCWSWGSGGGGDETPSSAAISHVSLRTGGSKDVSRKFHSVAVTWALTYSMENSISEIS